MINCYATGTVYSAGAGVGGVAGYVYEGTVANCYSTGNVGGVAGITPTLAVGGVVGSSLYGNITNCYATGQIASGGWGWYAGGIVGSIYNSSVSDCAALNPVVNYMTYSDGKHEFGRVAGYIDTGGTLTNNVAFDGMLNANSPVSWGNIGPNSADGADLSASDIIAASFWKTDAPNWSAWGSTWITTEGKLPILTGLSGQDGAMPTYIAKNG